ISHPVHDFDEWLTTFNSFAAFRTEGGVNALTVRRGVDDPNFVAVDLQFDTTDRARAFLHRLESEVWPNTPLLESPPATWILESVGDEFPRVPSSTAHANRGQ